MKDNLFYTSAKYVAIDLVGDILYWPAWWYSKGLLKVGLFCLTDIKDQEERLGLSIWIKNLFTPMFGQYDIEGRLISFFMRLIQIIIRSIVLVIWIFLMIAIFIIWIILPIIVIYQLVDNFLWLFY